MTAMRLKRYPSPSGGIALGKMGVGATLLKQGKTARDYVQDGLFRQVDSIENLGYGQHTDTPTAWRDLIQNDNWNINGATYENGMFIKNDGNTLPINVALTQAQVDAWRVSGASMEIVVVPTENATYTGCLAAIGWDGSLSIYEKNRYFGLGGTDLNYKVPNATFPTTATTFSVVTDGTATSIYRNGILVGSTQSYTAANIAYYFANWNATIGLLGNGRSQAANPNWSMPILGLGCKAFRLYSRALTADKIAYNYAIDKERFNLP